MQFDLLVDGQGNTVGIAIQQELAPSEFAQRFGVNPDEVHSGRFKIQKGMLVANASGTKYTYWSRQGTISMARIAQLSAVAGMPVLFFERDGEIHVFMSPKTAELAGFSMSECVRQADASEMVLLLAMKSLVEDPYVVAYRKFLESYK